MKRIATTFLVTACVVCGMQAQRLKQLGTGVDDIVPQGWSHYEATGDLNKDGKTDLVVMATPNFKEHMRRRDDGYEYNFNQPVLAVYFATADGKLKQWKQYGDVLPANDPENENCSWDISFDITERGALNISVQPDCSAGSYSTCIDRYTYRFQNDDFYLIGKEDEEIRRNTGEVTVNSENYLTWKRQVKKSNFSEDTPPTEKWTRLTKKPLEKLGARKLGEE
jgi:hypothetical protein